jgi:hypothetical protein
VDNFMPQPIYLQGNIPFEYGVAWFTEKVSIFWGTDDILTTFRESNHDSPVVQTVA